MAVSQRPSLRKNERAKMLAQPPVETLPLATVFSLVFAHKPIKNFAFRILPLANRGHVFIRVFAVARTRIAGGGYKTTFVWHTRLSSGCVVFLWGAYRDCHPEPKGEKNRLTFV